eukprot:TRINITY_DN11001_c0_g1_i1.p1 TRINITY_DN11001_c0_g1~~TRINITY_DN11001_c0_g1_i1.p1  ORF type:complete len:168 (+),score=19.87 TRINITY_DN11001_c0_g1_i1:68-505(+)
MASLLRQISRTPAAPLGAMRYLAARGYALAPETKSRIEDMIRSKKIFVFMKGTPDMPMCGFSKAVVQILDISGVTPEHFDTCNVLEDEDIRSGIKEFSDWPTIPQVYFDGEFVGGCDLMLQMYQAGELDGEFEKLGIKTSPKSEE